MRRVLLLPLLLVSACGSGGGANGADSGTPIDGAVAIDAPPGTSTMRLVTSQYNLNNGEVYYPCQRLTVPDALHILKITPVSPTGVHHEVFAIDESRSMPDGVTRCGPLGTRWRTLFASGVNSPSLTMPSGVQLEVPAGSQIVLGLHLFNV